MSDLIMKSSTVGVITYSKNHLVYKQLLTVIQTKKKDL